MTFLLTAMIALSAPQTPVEDYPVQHAKKTWRATEVVHRDRRRAVVRPYNAKLNRMAWCESTGRWFIATGNGFFGGLQFDLRTWWSVGGRGYPHQNSILEQKYRAVRLIQRRGYAPWPVCGYR